MDILLRLFLAHFIADYFLQTPKMVSQKMEKGFASPLLLVHVLAHIVVSLLLVFDLKYAVPVLMIGSAHYLIDIGKIYLSKFRESYLWYYLDQLMHFLVILIVWRLTSADVYLPQLPPGEHVWVVLLGFVVLSQPTAITLRLFLARWTRELNTEQNLSQAGTIIGLLERFLVLIFILSGNWEAIGFLIAAKSVFRFSDLKDAHSRQLTEYILIGTLSSFGIAVLVGLVCSYLLTILP